MNTEVALTELLLRIGKKLHDLRMLKNEKIDNVAIAAGKSKSVISDVEHGKYRSLCFDLLVKLAAYYKVGINDLLRSFVNDDEAIK